MAEGLQETLKEINQKLKKLDDLDKIQMAVNAVQKSLQNVELRITSLETSQATASRDIKIRARRTPLRNILSLQRALKTSRKKTKQAFANLQKENEAFQAKLIELEDKNLYLETYSRRQNLKFENIVSSKQNLPWRM